MRRCDGILEAPERRPVLRAHVLQEQERPAGRQHSGDLRQRGRRILDGAEHVRADHRVEAPVGERERRQPGLVDLGPGGRPPEHPRAGIGEYQFVQAPRVMGKVEPVTGADLEYPPPGPRQQLTARRCLAGPFGLRGHRWVVGGKQPLAQVPAHDRLFSNVYAKARSLRSWRAYS
jgi:hypothetical protein